ncbi:hypothetical protein L195_g046070 [Trifolium pratense]|uniref:Uncharacterized protein n=1 Tax=Trifolium pratense TaxID=57577 RepID=A0A2K3MGN0_TRIPR|nr:hypothetical protein L195_g046070 [Trifolium pratense]
MKVKSENEDKNEEERKNEPKFESYHFSADLRGYCPVRSFENGDFSPVGTWVEAKTSPRVVWGGNGEASSAHSRLR